MTFRNGHVFNGVFHKGKCRFGRYNTGKEYYEGMMGENDQPHGLGLYCYEDGVRYVGMWSDGKQHGEGWEVGVLGVVRKGLWNDGCWQRWFQLG